MTIIEDLRNALGGKPANASRTDRGSTRNPASAGRHRGYSSAAARSQPRAKPWIVDPVRPSDDPGLPKEDWERVSADG